MFTEQSRLSVSMVTRVLRAGCCQLSVPLLPQSEGSLLLLQGQGIRFSKSEPIRSLPGAPTPPWRESQDVGTERMELVGRQRKATKSMGQGWKLNGSLHSSAWVRGSHPMPLLPTQGHAGTHLSLADLCPLF